MLNKLLTVLIVLSTVVMAEEKAISIDFLDQKHTVQSKPAIKLVKNPFENIIADKITPYSTAPTSSTSFKETTEDGNLVTSPTTRRMFLVTDHNVYPAQAPGLKPGEQEPKIGTIQEMFDESNPKFKVPHRYLGNGVWKMLATREEFGFIVLGKTPLQVAEEERIAREKQLAALALEARLAEERRISMEQQRRRTSDPLI